VTVANDEIYEKYLQKAITESNALGDELAQAAGGARVPVLGSGHPLADVFLLKYSPKASELQEGVAFYGRAGNALLKSLQRLHVDPMEVYGTNCVKFSGNELGVAAEWLRRELRIVEPKLVVVMGDGTARRSRAAPGYWDERAEGFDAAVLAALAAGDSAALAALDLELAAELLCAGAPVWAAAGALLSGAPMDAEVRYEEVPFGVQYIVASWSARG